VHYKIYVAKFGITVTNISRQPVSRFQTGGTGASNVIPGDLNVQFNLRFSTELTDTIIKQRVESILDNHEFKYTLEWTLSGHPFLTPGGKLVDATKKAIKSVCNIDSELSTAGGTSDGRFIAPTGAQVIELGPINESIHKIDENINVVDLDKLKEVYLEILNNLFT
jgi:succinyl-diaminopimelate desuccinylase